MKYGVHLALWMKSWQDDVLPYLEEAASLGFDGGELSLLGMDEGRVARLRRAADELGVELTCTTGLANESDVTSSDPAVRRAGIRYLEWAVRTTASLGSRLLSGVIYAPWGKRQQQERGVRWQRSVEALAAIAPLAADHGVTLGIEAINRYETDLITTAAQARRFVDQVDAPNVGVLLDSYHLNIEEKDIGAAVREVGDRLVHLHCVENDRGAPGSGHLPWDDLFIALRDIDYHRWATLELWSPRTCPSVPT